MFKNNNKQGFTLVEVLITVAIFTIIMFGVTLFQKEIFSFVKIINKILDEKIKEGKF